MYVALQDRVCVCVCACACAGGGGALISVCFMWHITGQGIIASLLYDVYGTADPEETVLWLLSSGGG